MLSFKDVACRRDGKQLFSSVSLTIHAGEKVALTGANGSGKSSLFAMIQGWLEPDTGTISLQQHIGITHVAQETPSSDKSAMDYVLDGDQRVRLLEQAIAECGDEEGEKLANLHAEFDQAGGYTARSRAGTLLNGLGFSHQQHEAAVKSFSGGWRMRLNLAQALMSPNELLLLDEPTNHLDLDAVLWLEEWLRQRQGTLVLISHDREFLDSVTSSTMHIEAEHVDLFSGNYSAFERWRAASQTSQQALHEKSEARKRELQAFVDRFRAKATKARQAQSRLKMLQRMGDTEAVRIATPFSFRFHKPENMPSPLVVLENAGIGYGEDTVLQNVNFTVQSGDRVGLLGVNGAGKSTLVKALVGALPLMQGTRTPARKLTVGYFAQHQVDQLRSDQSALQAIQTRYPQTSDAEARNFLGSFGFHGDQAMQPAATLSGGERARLALALIVQARPNLLLLDEPTNHLDITMRQALADALVSFEGALLVISHDRTMLRTVVDELWLVASGSLDRFDDDLDGYARWISSHRQQAAKVLAGDKSESPGETPDETADNNSPLDRRQKKRQQAEKRALLAPLNKAVACHEKALEKVSSRLAVIREKLSEEDIYQAHRKEELAQLLSEESDVRADVEKAEVQLLESMEQVEAAQATAED
ncbi:MAG: ATP-binding cassette domain-containing protein [Granulosicoccus sp.]